MFLKRVHELLLGEHDFYDDVFHSLGVPYEAVKWRRRRQPDRPRGGDAAQADAGRHAHPRAPRARPPHRRPRPAALEGAASCRTSSTRPPTASPSGTSTASSSPAASAARDQMTLGDLLGVLRDAYCRTIGVEYMHIQDTDEQRWIQAQGRGRHAPSVTKDEQAPHPRAAQRGRGVREVPRHEVRRHQALRPRGRRVGHPDPRRGPVDAPPTPASTAPCSAWPTAAGSTCSPTSWARATTRSSASSRATSTPTPCRARAT